MPKVQTITTNFSAGERSPMMEGRVDLERYGSSAKRLRNCVVTKHGGITMRPSRDFRGLALSPTMRSRLIPFVVSAISAFMLELSHLKLRVWKDGAPMLTLETPYSAGDLDNIDFASSGDTMILVDGRHEPMRLLHLSDSKWVLAKLLFGMSAMAELGRTYGTLIQRNRTLLTASEDAFVASDLGRMIGWGTGRGEIYEIVDARNVRINVLQPFDNNAATKWTVFDSPRSMLTFNDLGQRGDGLTVTASLPTFGPNMIGHLIEFGAALYEIVVFTSPTVVTVKVLRPSTSKTAPSDSWGLKRHAWNEDDGYPRTVSFFQQRLWFGGSTRYPTTIWGSRLGLNFDFEPGPNDDDAVYKTIDTDDATPIQFLCSAWTLLALTASAEHVIQGGIERPISPTNTQIKLGTSWGTSTIRPLSIGDRTLFVQRGGTVLRDLTESPQTQASGSADLTIFSDHLFVDGIGGMSYQRIPNLTLWLHTSTGDLVAGTVNPEQNMIAFASGDAQGRVESIVTVPKDNQDVTYMAVCYRVNGKERRFIEAVNWGTREGPGMDARMSIYLPSKQTRIVGLTHLEGMTVSIVADGLVQEDAVVRSGMIDLKNPASVILVGLGYKAQAVLTAPEVGTGSGTSQSQAKSTNEVSIRLHQTIGCKVNGRDVAFRHLDAENTLNKRPAPVTGFVRVGTVGWGNESDLVIEQNQPYPWTVLAVVRSITVNTG